MEACRRAKTRSLSLLFIITRQIEADKEIKRDCYCLQLGNAVTVGVSERRWRAFAN